MKFSLWIVLSLASPLLSLPTPGTNKKSGLRTDSKDPTLVGASSQPNPSQQQVQDIFDDDFFNSVFLPNQVEHANPPAQLDANQLVQQWTQPDPVQQFSDGSVDIEQLIQQVMDTAQQNNNHNIHVTPATPQSKPIPIPEKSFMNTNHLSSSAPHPQSQPIMIPGSQSTLSPHSMPGPYHSMSPNSMPGPYHSMSPNSMPGPYNALSPNSMPGPYNALSPNSMAAHSPQSLSSPLPHSPQSMLTIPNQMLQLPLVKWNDPSTYFLSIGNNQMGLNALLQQYVQGYQRDVETIEGTIQQHLIALEQLKGSLQNARAGLEKLLTQQTYLNMMATGSVFMEPPHWKLTFTMPERVRLSQTIKDFILQFYINKYGNNAQAANHAQQINSESIGRSILMEKRIYANSHTRAQYAEFMQKQFELLAKWCQQTQQESVPLVPLPSV